VVRSLIDREVLKRSGSRWQVPGEIPTNYVPEALHGLILARLDRLDPETRRLLQRAAVIGRTFSFRVLRAVTQDDTDLLQRLVLLQRAELIRELRRGPEQAYTFIHALTQQVAYETLLRRQRRENPDSHCIEEYADRRSGMRFGFSLCQRRGPVSGADFSYQVHWLTALCGNKRPAYHAWEIVRANRAGNQETERLLHEAQGNLDLLAGDYRAALDQYEAALALTHDLAQRARLLRKLGNVCQGSGNYEQGLRYLEQGLALAGASGDSSELASLRSLGQIHHVRVSIQAADLDLQALAVFQQVGIAWHGTGKHMGIANWAMGDLPLNHLEKSLLIHASLGDVPGLASYNNLGRVLADEGYTEQALNSFLQSKQLCLEIGHQHGLAIALSHLGELYQRSGQSEEAVACQEQAHEIYNRIAFDGQEIQSEVLRMQVW
jgi:tetratricopeptide (TPR) repeat protein